MTTPESTTADARSGAPHGSSGVTMYTTSWCGFCHRLRLQLDRAGVSYDVVDIEQVAGAAEIVERVNHGNQTVPTLVYSDGSSQTNPSAVAVQDKLAELAGR